jgi:hypothetical protein
LFRDVEASRFVLLLNWSTLNRARNAAKRDRPKAIEFARPNRFVTFNQLDELLRMETRAETMALEDIEAILGALSDEGIKVVEGN